MSSLFKSILNEKTVALAFGLSSSVGWAVPIAIIDSGTDLKHLALVDHAWTNPGGIPGDDFKDDVHGWNFAENNNQIIDYSYMGKFSSDTTKYFEVQLKRLNGTATEEELKWFEEKRKDENFIKELGTFANFVHGTHVSGIASKGAPKAQIMAAKILPTEVKLPKDDGTLIPNLATRGLVPFSFDLGNPPLDVAAEGGNFLEDMLMKMALSLLVSQQAKTLDPVGKYVKTVGMSVANCSFGTGMDQAKKVIKILMKALFKRDPSDEEAEKYATHFMNQILEKGKNWMATADKTLFVIAAGNDGSDNDKHPEYPANLKLENSISVAATRNYDRLASFSNYGATMVDIAAPGVGILSAIPTSAENEMMAMSGTSQAAPFIANVVGKVMDANPKLSIAEVKKILMQTVDKKSFLEGKVASAGIANEERAVYAARLSAEVNLEEAVSRAKTEVKDFSSRASRLKRHGLPRTTDTGYDGEATPLPSLFLPAQ